MIILIRLKDPSTNIRFANIREYNEYYKGMVSDQNLMTYSDKIKDSFDDTVILNNYEDFITRTYHIMMGRLKNKEY